MNMIICPRCRQPWKQGALICEHCGFPEDETRPVPASTEPLEQPRPEPDQPEQPVETPAPEAGPPTSPAVEPAIPAASAPHPAPAQEPAGSEASALSAASPADPARTIVADISELKSAILAGYGTPHFEEQQRVIIFFKDVSIPVEIHPSGDFLLGRRTPDTDYVPDFDLEPYGASQNGVSRKHALLRRDTELGQLQIIDVNSRNGTYVNEERLSPGVPRTLRDGDLVRLGTLAFYVYFK
jgi:hypothetical protein